MADFASVTLTALGEDLLAKAQAGAPLVITDMALGDGYLPPGVPLRDLTALVHERARFNVQTVQRVGTGTVRVRAVFSNDQLVEGFPVREVGIFAEDPDLGEILYGVTSAGDNPDYLPAEGSATVAEMQLDVVLIVTGVAEVTALIDDTLILVSKIDLAEAMDVMAGQAFYWSMTM